MRSRLSKNFPAPARGFTLTELMVVVSIAVVLTGFSYAGFSSWQRKEGIRSKAYLLAATLKEARFRTIEQSVAHGVEVMDNATTGGKDLVLFKKPDGVRENVRRVDLGDVEYFDNSTKYTFEFDSKGFATAGTIGFKNSNDFYCNAVVSFTGRIRVECEDSETYGID